MKGKITVKRTAALFLIAALLVLSLVVMLPQKTTAANAATGKIFYYVDAGNLAVNPDGTGAKGDRGVTGYPSKVRTPFMQERQLNFGSSATIGENQLYNSVTDKEFGADSVTGKEWGFNSYADANSWRYGKTASSVDGYDTSRYTNEKADDDVVLEYKFEVDDATTAMTLKIGTRTMSGWGNKGDYDITINDEAKTPANSKETDQEFEYTGVTGKAEGGKFYVTLKLGTIDQTVFVNRILITSSDYVLPEAGEVYTFDKFVKRGEAPSAKNKIGENVSATVSEADQLKIDSAPILGTVSVNASIGTEVFENTIVNVLPKDTVYMLDVGASSTEPNVKGDQAYSNGYGYTGDVGNTGWGTSGFDQSCRYNDKGTKKLVYKFDAANGVYGVVAGTAGHWGGDRSMYLSVNGGEKLDFKAVADIATSTNVGGITVDAGSLEVEFSGNGNDPLVTYILVYKMDTVTFDANGGSVVAPVYFEAGTEHSLNNIAVRTGYTFNGWFTAAEGGTSVTSVNVSTTVYAQWTPKTYTVTLNKAGGEFGEISTVSTTTGQAVSGLVNGTKTGHNFDGWFTAASGGEKVANGDIWAHDVSNLYAQFTPKTYTVVLDYNDEGTTPNGSVSVNFNGEITLPEVTAQVGEFIGWYTALSGGDKIENGSVWTIDDDSATLYARYIIPVEIEITLQYNNGTANGSLTVIYNEAVAGLPENVAKDGYAFDGWYTEAEGGKKYQNGDLWKEIDTVLNLYARFVAADYSITYSLDSGINHADNKNVYTFGEGTALNAPTRQGYVFDGWYTEAAFTNKVTEISATDFGDKNLYAKWSLAKWTVTFDSKGGSEVAAQAGVENGGKASKPTDPTRDGYNFKGWYTDSSCLVSFDFGSATITANTTLYAKWEAKEAKTSCGTIAPFTGSNGGFAAGGGLAILALGFAAIMLALRKKQSKPQ